MTEELARIEHEERDGVSLVRLLGEVDLSNADALEDRILALVENSANGLVLDLAGTSYLDSAGVRLLFDLAAKLGRRGQALRLVVPPDALLYRVLELSHVGQVAQIEPDAETACRGLSPEPRG